MLTIKIEGAIEPLIDSSGRDRRCPLCGNLFEMGSLHGRFELDIDEGIADEAMLIAADEFGHLVCPSCLSTGAKHGVGGLRVRLFAYAEYLEATTRLLHLLASGRIELAFDADEIPYTGKVAGGPLTGFEPLTA